MRRSIITLAAVSAAMSPLGAAVPSPEFEVAMTMQVGSAPPTKPRLITRTGEPATFAIADERHNMRIVATVDAQQRVALTSLVSGWTPQGMRHYEKNATLTVGGAPATIAFASSDPATGTTERVSIEVRVQRSTR